MSGWIIAIVRTFFCTQPYFLPNSTVNPGVKGFCFLCVSCGKSGKVEKKKKKHFWRISCWEGCVCGVGWGVGGGRVDCKMEDDVMVRENIRMRKQGN
jgi:hypothetical protein